jgi:hypothetical protein
MTDTIYCPAQTYRQTRDSPAEYCENEVTDYGDFCATHDAEDRSDADYEQFLEDQREDL